MTPLIRKLREQLQDLTSKQWLGYTVPGSWVGSTEPVRFPSAPAYLLHQLSVLDALERNYRHRTWKIERALAYNCLIRHVAAYHHGERVDGEGWRTSGTFLKMLGMIPYLLTLGVDTLVLLPITEIGSVGRKGTLGSPYAVKHPLHLDPLLLEPAVKMSAEDQVRILIEVCHAVGIKVIVEFALRTASIDSDLALQHPEWFYWVDEGMLGTEGEEFKPPQFSAADVASMKSLVEHGKFSGLPEPSAEYQALFQPPPLRLEKDEKGWKGIAPKNKILRIPGAFADWPVDDLQPAWSDVTYLRLHDHPHYRYMAYNTVRMYERDLERDEYRAHTLWNMITATIPYFQRAFNIDGAMIDMGHAMPRDLRRRVISEARAAKPQFLLFEENFTLDATSRAAGYDAAVGYLPFDAMNVGKLKTFVEKVAKRDVPIRFFATPETHNTPRAASRTEHKQSVGAVWSVIRLLTHGLAFVHAGLELGETMPVNTGLGFTAEEINDLPPEKLPLFSSATLPWDIHSPVLDVVKSVQKTLSSSSWWETASDDDEIVLIPTKKSDLIVFVRRPSTGRQGILCIANLGPKHVHERITLPRESGVMFLAPHHSITRAGKGIEVDIPSMQCEYVFTLH